MGEGREGQRGNTKIKEENVVFLVLAFFFLTLKFNPVYTVFNHERNEYIALTIVDMNFEKANSLYRNDKTLQILRADHFPLLISFFHLAFKQQDKIFYTQTDLRNLLSDYLYSLELQNISDYPKEPLEYLQQWSAQGYLRRYYNTGDEPVYELTPATENALKWLEDLNKQQFIGTHSRLRQLFAILQQIVSKTAGPKEQLKKLEADKKAIEVEIEKIEEGIYERPDDTSLKEDYLLAEETAKRLLADFRQVEQNFRELDMETRKEIIKSNLPKGKLLDEIFNKQDYLWNTDQGKSFKSFWEFLMSDSMQKEMEELIQKINTIAALQNVREETTIERIKTNLVDAGDKVNRTNDGLIEQIRKFVEQKSLLESKRILKSIETIESLLIEAKESIDTNAALMEIDGLVKPFLFMERPLFNPPAKIVFENVIIEDGQSNADTHILFEQFHIDIEILMNNVKTLLRTRSQIPLSEVLEHYKATKGVAEILAYVQIASKENRHYINNQETEELFAENVETGKVFKIKAPTIIFNR